jgi:hypothetical protein
LLALAAKQAIWRKVGYTPHSAGQMSYHESPARFKVAVCGRRYGKSTMGAADKEAYLFMPNTLGWIVGPTYDLGEKEFRVMWDHLIVGLGLGKDKRVKKSYNKRMGDMYIEMPWGARVEVRSATQPERLVGEKLHWAIMSEAAKHNIETWQRFIRPSLADYRGSCDFPTTPEGYNWLYSLWQLGFDDSFPNYQSWRFPSWENPIVYPGGRMDDEIIEIERTVTPEWFAQEIAADFSAFVGKIYQEFEESTHVKTHTFNPAWPNYVAFDFGFVNPLAAVEFQVSPSDDIYIWREHYKSYMRVEEHCVEMKRRDQPDGYHLDLAFGDPADPEAVETVSVCLVPCIALPECKTNWRSGVDEVKRFLKLRPNGKEDEFGTPELEPKLFVDPSCKNVIREFNSYKADDKVKSNTRESSTASAAVKVDDHALDAIRYALVHIYQLGVTASLAEVAALNGIGLYHPDEGAGYGTSRGLESAAGLFSMGEGRIQRTMEDF